MPSTLRLAHEIARDVILGEHAFVARDRWASLCAVCNLSIAAHESVVTSEDFQREVDRVRDQVARQIGDGTASMNTLTGLAGRGPAVKKREPPAIPQNVLDELERLKVINRREQE